MPIEETAEKPRDLGPPLVDNVDKLKPLQPESLVWLDMQNRQVVFLGQVCRADYPLEFFVTYREKSYESIIASDVKPWLVHTGLLALGAEAGHPVRFQPEFVPPSGTEVAIEVRWKDAEGKVRSSPARDWVRNVKTKEPLDTNWVFAGSALVTDEATGERHYLADGGDFICLLNLPDATLDLPIRSASSLESRSFEAFLEHLPPAGTPVTILLKPKVEKERGEAIVARRLVLVRLRVTPFAHAKREECIEVARSRCAAFDRQVRSRRSSLQRTMPTRLRGREHGIDAQPLRIAANAGAQHAAHQVVGQSVQIAEAGDVPQFVLHHRQQINPIDGPRIDGLQLAGARGRRQTPHPTPAWDRRTSRDRPHCCRGRPGSLRPRPDKSPADR